MDLYKEQLEQARRIEKVGDVYVQISLPEKDHSYFTVYDKDDIKKIKYFGKILDDLNDNTQFCTCPDNTHRNTKTYMDTHAEAFQCKHQLAYREYLKKFYASLKEAS